MATASAALSASLGYVDGERIKRSTLIEFLERIARSVEIPVTADVEAGYGESLDALQETIRHSAESYACFGKQPSGAEVAQYLNAGREEL